MSEEIVYSNIQTKYQWTWNFIGCDGTNVICDQIDPEGIGFGTQELCQNSPTFLDACNPPD
jgi:hypothetical protein